MKTSFSWLRNRWVLRITSLVIFLILWELISMTVNPILKLLISSPTWVAGALYEVTVSGELFMNLLVTLETLAVGFVLAAVLGIPLGVLMGRWRSVEYLTDPYTTALATMPMAAIIPLVMVFTGIGFWSRMIVVFLFAYFPIAINTYAGFKNVSYELIETGRSFGANERQLFSKIMLPASIPFIMAGLVIGISRAFIGVILAEMFLAATGLGGMLMSHKSHWDVPVMYGTILVLSALGIVLVEVLKYVDKKSFSWKNGG